MTTFTYIQMYVLKTVKIPLPFCRWLSDWCWINRASIPAVDILQMSSHTEERWYIETRCLWMTIFWIMKKIMKRRILIGYIQEIQLTKRCCPKLEANNWQLGNSMSNHSGHVTHHHNFFWNFVQLWNMIKLANSQNLSFQF